MIVIVLAGLQLLDHQAVVDAPMFANAWFLSAMCVPLAGAGYALLHHHLRELGDRRDRPLQIAAAIGSGLLALAVVHLELRRGLGAHSLAAAWAVVPLWVAGSLAFLAGGRRSPAGASWSTGVLTAIVAGLLAAASYRVGPAAAALYLNPRFVVALGAIALGFAIWWMRRRDADRALGGIAVGLALLGLWLLLSVETYGHFARRAETLVVARWQAGMALTFVWGAFAIGLVAAGFRRHVRSLRLAGLALFGITAGKLVLVDLATIQQHYRVLSFLVIGLLMIAASYLYHRLERGRSH